MGNSREGVPTEVGGVTTRPLPPDDGRRARLLLRLPDGDVIKLDRSLRIGQSSQNDVVLRDETVSRRHCVIEVEDDRVFVRDDGSTNGTWVNGVRVPAAELKSGFTLAVGATRMRVVADTDGTRLYGESPAMERLRRDIAKLAPVRIPVLIQGETGTGKELVAIALHEQSGLRGQFVPLNCGSIPRELVESELFGHERGAFTGADRARAGVFQEANGGTLFLDEVGELPGVLQTRLLRVLETGRIRPVGASREIAVEVRVVAATHVNLERAMREGRFRSDLFFRLVGDRIHVPPLRARRDDVTRLARRFLDELGQGQQLADDAIAALERHEWPGNVRELRHVIHRAVVLGGSILHARDLLISPSLQLADDETIQVGGRAYHEIERELLLRTVARHGGNRTAAAIELGIPKSTLCDKVRRYEGAESAR